MDDGGGQREENEINIFLYLDVLMQRFLIRVLVAWIFFASLGLLLHGLVGCPKGETGPFRYCRLPALTPGLVLGSIEGDFVRHL